MLPIHVRETRAFVRPAVAQRRRILEVGCGDGALAGHLAAEGHDVVAIDARLRDTPHPPGVRLEQVPLLRFASEPFEALVAVAVLHHLSPLDASVAKLRELLVPGGVLVVDDFDLAAPDATTARWYYDAQDLLAAGGLFPPEAVHGTPEEAPLERWRHEHLHHDEPLHTGDDMLGALRDGGFELQHVTRGPYLFRYLARGHHGHTPTQERLAEYMLATERQRIAEGVFKPVGLRIVARRR
ncbi:class I SAM-dependent methyltransferase [Myxococcus landrumensis]|uniref:Class I SAM-dependent methyltransferase n=1 Tax=Myxococcus landrumensis TaxID=2813577 RepID=A0ABX7N0B4_9BACT|nr:class I SAM-dependent methyltransferase [Myxococcus landrumus]QSQ11893.1 class I SAM-dependent methyltransferase [Myxococcus landrumus]